MAFLLEQGTCAKLAAMGTDCEAIQEVNNADHLRIVDLLSPTRSNYSYHGQKGFCDAPQIPLTYCRHEIIEQEGVIRLDILQQGQGLQVITTYLFYPPISAFRCYSTVKNTGQEPILLDGVSSFSFADLYTSDVSDTDMGKNLLLSYARNTWSEECRWETHSLYELGIRSERNLCYDRVCISNHSGFSSGEYLPMGAVTLKKENKTLLWQIEHNGSWTWEIGNNVAGYDLPYLEKNYTQNIYIQLYGPRMEEGHWCRKVNPHESFTTVPAAVCMQEGGLEQALGVLTDYRRCIRPESHLSAVFNDYMNCMMGDSDEQSLIPLIDTAAELGCEAFVVDCGWYDTGNWQFTFGTFEESRERYPGGLAAIMNRIREKGMIPGIWLELESFGIDNRALQAIPVEWMLQRGGSPVIDSGRVHLDFRNEEVRTNASRIIDRVIKEYGVGYIKMDYNLCSGIGTDYMSDSPGDGLLEHNRNYLDWLDRTREQYPDIIWENCASGGLRMDYAMLSRMELQSTSDQEDYRRTSLIASCCASAVVPEQALVWNYPIRDDRKEITVNMVNSILFRTNLSGKITRLSTDGRKLLREGIELQKRLRKDIMKSHPMWPLGMNTSDCKWLVYGADCGNVIYLAVWKTHSAEDKIRIPLPPGMDCAKVYYPDYLCTEVSLLVQGAKTKTLECAFPSGDTAVLIRLTPGHVADEL